MHDGLILYLVLGMVYVFGEHRSLSYDLESLSRKELTITILQQMIHYFRVAVTWPLYLVEDFLIWLDNYPHEEEGEEGGEDDGE